MSRQDTDTGEELVAAGKVAFLFVSHLSLVTSHLSLVAGF
jgi:hypothetical protein